MGNCLITKRNQKKSGQQFNISPVKNLNQNEITPKHEKLQSFISEDDLYVNQIIKPFDELKDLFENLEDDFDQLQEYLCQDDGY